MRGSVPPRNLVGKRWLVVASCVMGRWQGMCVSKFPSGYSCAQRCSMAFGEDGCGNSSRRSSDFGVCRWGRTVRPTSSEPRSTKCLHDRMPAGACRDAVPIVVWSTEFYGNPGVKVVVAASLRRYARATGGEPSGGRRAGARRVRAQAAPHGAWDGSGRGRHPADLVGLRAPHASVQCLRRDRCVGAFEGPAIVEEASATTIVDDGGNIEVDAYGSLVIAVDLEEAPLVPTWRLHSIIQLFT